MSWCSPDDDLDDYHHKFPLKWLEHYRLDHTRRSMFEELQKDYERKLAWARSLGIDPLAEDFDPSAPVPSELSSWLYLFYCYLRVEEEYAEVGEWLKFWGHRLIDPPRPLRSFTEEAMDFWRAITGPLMEFGRPGSRASQHKAF